LLRGQRKDWAIVGKAGEEFKDGKSAFDFSPAAFEASLHRSLQRLNTDYLDVFLIHSDGRDLDILSSALLIEKMQDFKKRGLVRAIGASIKTAAGGIKALEMLDVVMATYTPDYQDEKPILDYAQAHHKGIILKKALSSGYAANTAQFLRFGLSHPATTSIVIGTINTQHLEDNAAAVAAG
jgi:aryl-alcohol dehydrogenase-like predicted oxidoreductase